MITSDVSCKFPVAEPPCWLMIDEVPSIRRVIGLEDSVEVVIIPNIYR